MYRKGLGPSNPDYTSGLCKVACISNDTDKLMFIMSNRDITFSDKICCKMFDIKTDVPSTERF